MFSSIPALQNSQQLALPPQSAIVPYNSAQQDRPQPPKTLEQQLIELWVTMTQTSESSIFSTAIKEYCLLLLNSQDEQLFLNYFIERKFMSMLSKKVKEHRQDGQVLRTVFSLFQFLLKALKKQQQLVYFLVKVSQEGFIGQEYVFEEEEDQAYYANFLKLMVRTINAEPRYLNVFFNSREPHFPLLLQLLKMYDCKDTIMQASSQLAILQISNNRSPMFQQYIPNFPFVLFYPLYATRILAQLRQLVAEDNPLWEERLQSSLRYLQDFVSNKERTVIDMYTNSFLKIVGRYIFEELSSLNEKNVSKGVRIMRILLDHVLPEVTIVKIRISLLCLFAPLIPSKMKKCFEAKGVVLQTRFWIPQTCSEEVLAHCRAIFYKEEPQNKSIFKSINIYIPRSKDNWLYYELKKFSDCIGYDILLNEPLNIDKHQNQSFLEALWTMIDDQTVRNTILATIIKTRSEELLYYYLKVLTALCECQEAKYLLDFEQLTQVMTSCTSLSLLQAFNNLVVKSKLTFLDSVNLQQAYGKVTEKLIHFVLTKGWREFLERTKDCRLPEYDIQFSTDIYREVECEILLFVSLRTMLGTDNSECVSLELSKWEEFPSTAIETIFKCYDSGRYGSLIYMILDGQFLNLKNSQEKQINRQELLLMDVQLVEEGEMVEVVGSNFSASLYLERHLKQYMLREVANRREMTDRVALELKQMKLEFNYK